MSRRPFAVLGLSSGATVEEVDARWRELRRTVHPDSGGSHDAFVEAERAYQAARATAERRAATQRRPPPPRAGAAPDYDVRHTVVREPAPEPSTGRTLYAVVVLAWLGMCVILLAASDLPSWLVLGAAVPTIPAWLVRPRPPRRR